MFNEFVLTNKNYIRTCTSIEDPKLLLEVAPDFFNLEKMSGYAYKRDLEKVKQELDAEKSDDE